MVKVQKVGNVVGWIVSVVWIVFLILLITTYANESAFVRVIHTILLPFGDINLNLCKDFAIAFCVLNFIASQTWRHGIRNNKKHFTLWSMVYFSLILLFLLICNLFFIGTDLQNEHPELIVILIVSLVLFGHLYIISYVSFKTIKDEIHRTPIIERQTDSSYSIPLRSVRESNSKITVLSDYGYRSDDGDVEAPMFCISPVATAPVDDGFEADQPFKSVHHKTSTFHEAQNCRSGDVQHYEPYKQIELSDCKIAMDDSPQYHNTSNDKPEYSHHTFGLNTAPHHTSDLYSESLHNSHDISHTSPDTHTTSQHDTCTSSDNTVDTGAATECNDSAACHD